MMKYENCTMMEYAQYHKKNDDKAMVNFAWVKDLKIGNIWKGQWMISRSLSEENGKGPVL